MSRCRHSFGHETDYTDNYYEYEIPLKANPAHGIYSSINRSLSGLAENELNVPLDLFQQVKLRRNDEKRKSGSLTFSDVYS